MPYPVLRFEYEFDDGDRMRSEKDDVSPDWAWTKGSPTVAVQYIPGTDSSRLVGNDHRGWLWGSAGLLVLGAICGGVWWKFRDAA